MSSRSSRRQRSRPRPLARLWRTANEHQILSGVITAALIAGGSGLFTFVRNRVNDSGDGPSIVVTVGGAPGPTDFEFAVPTSPPDVREWKIAASDSHSPLAWARDAGGASVEILQRRLVFAGHADSSVVTGMRAHILERLAPAAAVVDYFTAEGASGFGETPDAAIAFDKSATVANAIRLVNGVDSGPLFESQTLSLVRGETQTIDLNVAGCDCAFEVEVTVVSHGRETTLIVRDSDGLPFRLAAAAEDLPVWKLGKCADGSRALVTGSGQCIQLPTSP